VTFNASSYMSWLMGRSSHAHTMRWHRKVLQFLQRRERTAALEEESSSSSSSSSSSDAAVSGGRRWLLKTPQYQAMLDDVLREYPDAKIIQTHRAPLQLVGSAASVYTKMWGVASDHIDPKAIGAAQTRMTAEVIGKGMESRARSPELSSRIIDLDLDGLKAEPIVAVAKVYEHLELELTPEARRAMEKWLATKQVAHGKPSNQACSPNSSSLQPQLIKPAAPTHQACTPPPTDRPGDSRQAQGRAGALRAERGERDGGPSHEALLRDAPDWRLQHWHPWMS
jgi:hypothetical protein